MSYWSLTRRPKYSLLFALPLLVAYELLALALSGGALMGVRNGADVLLKSLFLAFGGRTGLVVFGVVLLSTGAWSVWRDRQSGGPLRWRVFGLMASESVIYASVLGLVTSTLTSLLLGRGGMPFAASQFGELSLASQAMISLGAGLYEELLFRVLLVGSLAWFARRMLQSPLMAGLIATLVGALVFSGFHYIGPYGDRLEVGSFAFRAVAGVLFSALYLLRGFGIAAWTHALYDLMLVG
ncbi:MAG TPA: CPBP family glutamic-type intramembrane protease [Gemmatimonadales bacterium]|nr:CPBP family glutamic-type intramembrane protease [Gemmatimonadales bacterium]